MGICADHHAAGESIVFQNDLVDDACPRTPEAHAIAACGGSEEVIDLTVRFLCLGQIKSGAATGTNEVVAVNRGRHGGGAASGVHELQHCHLCRGVLHADAVGMKESIGCAAAETVGGGRHCKVSTEDFFSVGQGTPHDGAEPADFFAVCFIEGFYHLFVVNRHRK